MRKVLLLLVTCCMVGISFANAQTYQMTRRISSTDMRELLEDMKELFYTGASISFNITTNDAIRSFDERADAEPYDPKYFAKQSAFIKADAANPAPYNNLGNYYNFLGKTDSAAIFFQKALDRMTLKYFNNDSARYLSFRGLMKYNLGTVNAIEDMERAAILNPQDSLVANFYPLFLMNNKEFAKLRDLTTRMLDADNDYPVAGYIMLLMGELMRDYIPKATEAGGNDSLRKVYEAIPYDKLLDYSLINKYTNKFSNDKAVKNARYMADIMALMIKMTFQEIDFTDLKFSFLKVEQERLAALENIFLSKETMNEINPYTRNKVLGFIYFMQGKNDKAIASFNESVKAFPASKADNIFNATEVYDAILGIHFMAKDEVKFKEMLLRKINAKPLGKDNPQDYYLMAQQAYRADDNKAAQQWVSKALELDSSNFDALRLKAHLGYLDRDEALQIYADRASRNLQTVDQQYKLVMQFTIYYILNGDATSAYNNIAEIRKTEGGDCKLCDKLQEKYITIIPK